MPTITLKPETVSDLLCSAFEGGSNYWVMKIRKEMPPGVTRPTYGFEFPQAGGKVFFTVDNHPCPLNGGAWLLDASALKRGEDVLAEKHLRKFCDAMLDAWDAETGDVFLQCCLFGEVVFG